MERQRRPLAFWAITSLIVFLAMTALWVFGEDPSGAVLALATILWWGSGLALVLLGLPVYALWRARGAAAPPGGA